MSKDMRNFIIVMIVFTIGMIVMVANHIHEWGIWAIYITIWTLVEGYIAKDFKLKWWVWVLILLGLSVIDAIVLFLLA